MINTFFSSPGHRKMIFQLGVRRIQLARQGKFSSTARTNSACPTVFQLNCRFAAAFIGCKIGAGETDTETDTAEPAHTAPETEPAAKTDGLPTAAKIGIGVTAGSFMRFYFTVWLKLSRRIRRLWRRKLRCHIAVRLFRRNKYL